METTTQRHPVAQALVDFTNGEATLWNINSQKTEQNKNVAMKIHRILTSWQDARRDMAVASKQIERYVIDLQKQLLDGMRTDGASWMKDPVNKIDRAALRADMWCDQLAWELNLIDMTSSEITALLNKLNTDAMNSELTV
jgi:hypothetical protein